MTQAQANTCTGAGSSAASLARHSFDGRWRRYFNIDLVMWMPVRREPRWYVPTMHPPLSLVAPGVWSASEPVRIVGMKLATNMTVLRLRDGELLVHSPVPITPERKGAVDALGQVTHLYAPNTFHHLWLGDWSRAYPHARVHAPRALAHKQPDLRIDRAHDEGREPDFDGVLDEVHVDGFALEETVLVHRPSRSLLVADLVHHVGRPRDLWTALYTRMMGFYDRVAISRAIALLAFQDRRAARRSLDAILAHEVERIVVGHGAPVDETPAASLRDAYAWLAPSGTSPALVRRRRVGGGACG
jgi:hypothetical protein